MITLLLYLLRLLPFLCDGRRQLALENLALRQQLAVYKRMARRPKLRRPRVDPEITALVIQMAAANPLWGAPRIHGELLKLGIHVAERTVSRLLPKRRTPPSQTWRTFLTNHVRDLVSIDFFIVPTVRLRVLFAFVVLAHDRRRVLHFNVTEYPTAAWTPSRSSTRSRTILPR